MLPKIHEKAQSFSEHTKNSRDTAVQLDAGAAREEDGDSDAGPQKSITEQTHTIEITFYHWIRFPRHKQDIKIEPFFEVFAPGLHHWSNILHKNTLLENNLECYPSC